LKLTKTHRGVKFTESDWMKEYIQLNTDLRTKGTTDFEKDFFKLMNNSVFGKTMENVRNRVDIRIVNDEKKWNKLAKKHNYKSATIFSENLVAVHMRRTSIKLKNPYT
jgi:predicted DNA binding protein